MLHASRDLFAPRLGFVRRAICSAPQILMCPQTTHGVPLPTPVPVRYRFSLVVTSHIQRQRTFPSLLPLIALKKFPEWSRHLHSLLLPRSCRSHVMDRHPPSPFVRLPGLGPLQPSSPPVEPGSVVGAGSGSGGVSLEAGPVRLTRFVGMSLEHYYSTVNEMVNAGRFEHIGRATVRVEGASAWAVWLRVDHWPTALGRHPRLRCGVLFHMANRTLSFHGIGSDAVQFLLPLFESWTYSSLPQLPSLRARRASSAVPPLDDPHPPAVIDSNAPLPHDRPRSSEVSSLRGLVQQLVELCRGHKHSDALPSLPPLCNLRHC